jgi:hypothetical protein
MNENKKLDEAKYFLEIMKSQKKKRKDFENNLSAFLTSSRSVFQYAQKECKTISGGQTWYDKKVNSNQVIKFLKDKRDLNIHSEPLKTQAEHFIESTATIYVSGTATVTDKDGNIISQSEFGQKAPKINSNITKASIIYRFNDWSGKEEIITLCELYIEEIEKFLDEGKKLKFIMVKIVIQMLVRCNNIKAY